VGDAANDLEAIRQVETLYPDVVLLDLEMPIMKIAVIKLGQFEAAKSVMESVTLELWGLTLDKLRQYDTLTDLDDIKVHYLDNGGTFLVLLDGETVVGTCGIHASGNQSCILKRLWLLKPYRGQGWGKQLVQCLINFAKVRGYRRVMLTVATPQIQEAAVGLYQKVGFIPLDKYTANNGIGQIMELTL